MGPAFLVPPTNVHIPYMKRLEHYISIRIRSGENMKNISPLFLINTPNQFSSNLLSDYYYILLSKTFFLNMGYVGPILIVHFRKRIDLNICYELRVHVCRNTEFDFLTSYETFLLGIS